MTGARRLLCALLSQHAMRPVSAYLASVTGLYWDQCWCGLRDDRWFGARSDGAGAP